MSDDLNIEDFYKDAALVLLFLYDSFPLKMELYVEDICGPDQVDDYGLHSDRYLACMSAIVWLAEEGMIRYESMVKQESFDQAVLSKKTFVLLNSFKPDEDVFKVPPEMPPTVAADAKTRIAQMKMAFNSGSSELLKHEMRAFLDYGESMSIRSYTERPKVYKQPD